MTDDYNDELQRWGDEVKITKEGTTMMTSSRNCIIIACSGHLSTTSQILVDAMKKPMGSQTQQGPQKKNHRIPAL
jgi:hypothetical protein